MAAGVLGTGLRASGLAAQPQAADSQGGAGTTSSSGPGDKQPDRHPLEPVPDKPATRLYDLLVQSAAAERSDAAPLSDETFIRRIYLDVLGRPATPAEIQKFNDEQAEHRFKLVDRVLKEVGASHRNKSEDVSPSKTTIVPSDDDLAATASSRGPAVRELEDPELCDLPRDAEASGGDEPQGASTRSPAERDRSRPPCPPGDQGHRSGPQAVEGGHARSSDRARRPGRDRKGRSSHEGESQAADGLRNDLKTPGTVPILRSLRSKMGLSPSPQPDAAGRHWRQLAASSSTPRTVEGLPGTSRHPR